MAIRVKAKESLQKIGKYKGTYRYVMRVDNYAKVDDKSILTEAAAHSGLSKGQVRAAWESITEIIGIYVTQGLTVSLPGLGTMRMGISAKSTEQAKDVKDKLITRRRIIFTPDVEIKQKVYGASISIGVYDRNGNEIVRNPQNTTPGTTPTTPGGVVEA